MVRLVVLITIWLALDPVEAVHHDNRKTSMCEEYERTGENNNQTKSCSPGFIYQALTRNCVCSAGTSCGYFGIEKCDLALKQAYVDNNYWVGYETDHNASEDTLLSGYCPKSFCSPQHGYLLPGTADKTLLEETVCAPNRTGVLCGACRSSYSVRYHSLTLKCEPDKYCRWGWMFFILSEIIPITIIFLLIISCNVSFSSGFANSFIFYAQTVKMLHVRADQTSLAAEYLLKIHQFIYFFINLDPFVLDEIAYCIWNNANALDIFSFGQITIVYSLFLIFLVVLVSSKCKWPWKSSQVKSRRQALQGSIIHGLTSFLLLFSSRAAHNSILILAYDSVYGKGYQRKKYVARYNGELEWLSLGHLPYAIPAFVLLILVSIPPIILVIYPIHYKILSICKMAEARRVKLFLDPLERLKPFLDSFQGCFKDNLRFFSGLFFIYRIILSVLMASLTPMDAHFSVSILLAILLVTHSACQPYVRRSDNIIDVLLLGNLLLINLIASYNVSKSAKSARIVSFFTWVQLLLIITPLVCLVVKLSPLVRMTSKLRRCFVFTNKSQTCELPESIEYGTFREE